MHSLLEPGVGKAGWWRYATDLFLRLNGWKFDVHPERVYKFLIGLLEGRKCDYDHLLPWIRRHLVKI